MDETTITKSIAIIGSGPAGYTAAIYGSRAGLEVILFEGNEPGGQLTTTTEVENYPGYPKGVLGRQMMQDFKEQAERFGTQISNATITKVDFSTYPFQLTTDQPNKIVAKVVIIATGASAKWLGLETEKKFQGRGVSACAICDGFFFKDQTVAVVGGGDTAAEEALYLSKICKKVYLLVRNDRMRASYIMQQRIYHAKNIIILFNTEVQDIMGNNVVEHIRIKNNKTTVIEELAVEGVFVAIGHQPNTNLFSTFLNIDKHGYIITKAGSTKTNIPGIFAAGDVQDPIYRQAVTAAGTGCMAALEAEKFLTEQTHGAN